MILNSEARLFPIIAENLDRNTFIIQLAKNWKILETIIQKAPEEKRTVPENFEDFEILIPVVQEICENDNQRDNRVQDLPTHAGRPKSNREVGILKTSKENFERRGFLHNFLKIGSNIGR